MDTTQIFRAQASPNIALIKYWGNRDSEYRIPSNNSLSMTLGELTTTTQIQLDPSLPHDELWINDQFAEAPAQLRASALLAMIRQKVGSEVMARVNSQNNFPMGTGIASSASAFAALSVAGCAAYELELDSRALSRLARRASGSAARSIFPGFVELHAADREEEAYAEAFLPETHWDLVDLIAVVNPEHKAVSSSAGHRLAETSPIQTARVTDTPRRIKACKRALEEKDFDRLASIVELDSNLMHAVMISSEPPILYWEPGTITIMQHVTSARQSGIEVCYTIDAGPNVHCICTDASLASVRERLESLRFIEQIYVCRPGPGATLL